MFLFFFHFREKERKEKKRDIEKFMAFFFYQYLKLSYYLFYARNLDTNTGFIKMFSLRTWKFFFFNKNLNSIPEK